MPACLVGSENYPDSLAGTPVRTKAAVILRDIDNVICERSL